MASNPSTSVLPEPSTLSRSRSQLLTTLPATGLGLDAFQAHLTNDLIPGFSNSSKSPHYYGFVTGGATPASILGDHAAVDHDQNVQVHLPDETIATDVEDKALRMLCELVDLPTADFEHRTFTTGATASNVVGLACGREFVLREASAIHCRSGEEASVAQHGLVEAQRMANIERIQILTTAPHSSLRKAASIIGLGRACIRDLGRGEAPQKFDLEALRAALAQPGTASIVVISCAEVNTGLFATDGEEVRAIRKLCDQYGAWIHVDAAFGLWVRALPDSTEEYRYVKLGGEGLELADSITGDAHKLLNVPYDCGIFLSKHLPLAIQVFQNTNAAYLNTSSATSIPSPLQIGLENSRRFRALPVYASLATHGREGYVGIFQRQIQLARRIARFIHDSAEFELLPRDDDDDGVDVHDRLLRRFVVVLFRVRDGAANASFVARVNALRRVYVSGTRWEGEPAARFAVANWQVDVERDIEVVKGALREALGG